jgi:hypothetical protein
LIPQSKSGKYYQAIIGPTTFQGSYTVAKYCQFSMVIKDF